MEVYLTTFDNTSAVGNDSWPPVVPINGCQLSRGRGGSLQTQSFVEFLISSGQFIPHIGNGLTGLSWQQQQQQQCLLADLSLVKLTMIICVREWLGSSSIDFMLKWTDIEHCVCVRLVRSGRSLTRGAVNYDRRRRNFDVEWRTWNKNWNDRRTSTQHWRQINSDWRDVQMNTNRQSR